MGIIPIKSEKKMKIKSYNQLDEYYKMVSDLKDNESYYPSEKVQNLYIESLKLKREIKSNLMECRMDLIDSIRDLRRRRKEYFLNLPVNLWEEENCQELENDIYESEKELSHVEEEIKRFS